MTLAAGMLILTGCYTAAGRGFADLDALASWRDSVAVESAAADVGVAVRGGAEVSLQAAPVFVASSSLAGVAQLFRGSTRTSWLIIAAFCVSLSYNVLAVGLAMAGKITPLTAAVLMPVSSISVLSMTPLWPTFRESDGWV